MPASVSWKVPVSTRCDVTAGDPDGPEICEAPPSLAAVSVQSDGAAGPTPRTTLTRVSVALGV